MIKKEQIVGLALVIVAYYFIFVKRVVKKMVDEKESIRKIRDEYGIETATNVEKMFRLETNHFKSKGYKLTNGAGMEAVRPTFPFGWSQKYFQGVNYSNDLVHMTDSGGRDVHFIKFDTPYDGMKVLANWLQSHRVGNWYSTDPNKQKEYEKKVNAIRSQYITTL